MSVLLGDPYPPFVVGDEQRRRWDMAGTIAESVIEGLRRAGDSPDAERMLFWRMQRQLYLSDIPTDPPEGPADLPVEEADFDGDGFDDDHEPDHARVLELLAAIKDEDPGPDADPEERWAHTGLLVDLLDELMGDPDRFDFAEHEYEDPADDDRPLLPAELHEEDASQRRFTPPRAPYKEPLHPRSRLGKWVRKLGALRSAAHEHGEEARTRLDARVGSKAPSRVATALAARRAAARLHYDLKRSTKEGGALYAAPGKLPKLTGKENPEELRKKLLKHGAEQRRRQGLSGKRQQVVRARTVAAGTALTALAATYSADSPHSRHGDVFGPVDKADPQAYLDAKDRAELAGELAKGVTGYVAEHQEELRAVAHVVGHVARSAARAKGYVSAAAFDADEVDADLSLAELVLDVAEAAGDDPDDLIEEDSAVPDEETALALELAAIRRRLDEAATHPRDESRVVIEIPAPVVHVAAPEVNVSVEPTPIEVSAAPVTVNVPEQPAPVVRNEITVEPAKVDVDVEVELKQPAKKVTVRRDLDGKIESARISDAKEEKK